MDGTINIDLLSVGIATAAIGILGITVLINDRRNITNVSFLLFSLLTVAYGLANYLNYQVRTPELILLWLRVTIFFATWHAFSLFQLFYVFPDSIIRFPRWYKFFLVPWVTLVSVLTLTPLVFKDIHQTEEQVATAILGPAIPLFGLTAGILVVMAIVRLFIKLRRAPSIQRASTKLVLVGTLITFSLILTFNLILPVFFENVRFVPLAPVYILPFIIFTAYAIVRHGLFDVKVIVTELLAFALWMILLLRTLTENNFFDRMVDLTIFIATVIIGIWLIRSVLNEVETREKMEGLAVQLEVANSELKKLDEAKSDFISIASHQLRTPLTIIKGYISMMREGTFGKLTKKVADPLDKVYISNERLINLVADLLDLSRMERGKMVYDMREVHLVPAVEGLITDFKIAAENKGLKYSWSKKVENDVVKADENKIRQIILNFIDNSIKYTPSGKVDVALVQEGNQLRFSVTDTGSGLTEEEANTLFQKFVRGQQEKKSHTEGLGLGLYVAKLIAEAHGGTLGATSPGKGKGSTFYLTIPLLDQTKEKVEEFASKI